MSRFRTFVKTTIFGGIAVLLPLALFAMVYAWMYAFLTGLLEPLSDRFLSFSPRTERIVADIAVVFFLIGLAIVGRVNIAQGIREREALAAAPHETTSAGS